MEMKRLFISTGIDLAMAKDLEKKFLKLNLPWEKIKTVPTDQMHVTFKFLGDTPFDMIPDIVNSLEKINLKKEYIDLEIDKPIIFNEKYPKVLSLKLKKSKELDEVFKKVEDQLFEDGITHKEIRQFTPHITLGRIKKKSEYNEFKEFVDWNINNIITVTSFELKESNLTKKGPEHTVLQSFNI